MAGVQALFLSIAVLQGLHAALWTSGPQNGDVIYACQGANVSLPWRFQPGAGDVITDIQWYYRGRSEEVMGVLIHGNFVAYPAFAGRVTYTDTAGVILEGVLTADSGNYSVVVTGHNATGQYFELRNMVTVEISDHLMTLDGRLHVSQRRDPVWDDTEGQWTIELLCGVFSFLGTPPYFVEWITPNEIVRNSSLYDNGYFHLSLSSAVPSGTYICRVPYQHLNDSCLLGQDAADAAEASVEVDGVVVSLALMRKEIQQLGRHIDQVEVQVAGKIHKVEGHLEEVERHLNETNFSLETLMGPCHSHTHTTIDDPRRVVGAEYHGPDKLCDTDILQSGHWYRFLLHNNSAVIPTSCVPKYHCHTYIPMWLDLQGQSLPAAGRELDARACSPADDNNCCYWTTPVTVQNCGDYFVYKLHTHTGCTFAHCVEPQS